MRNIWKIQEKFQSISQSLEKSQFISKWPLISSDDGPQKKLNLILKVKEKNN